MAAMPNPTGKRRPKRRHHGEGTVVHRTDRWRAKPWAAVVPYTDASGRRREMWLSAASRAEADELRKAELARIRKGGVRSVETVAEYVSAWLATVDVGPGTSPRYRAHLSERIAPSVGNVPLESLTPQMVRTAVRGWGGAPATRAGALRLLRAAMNQAVADRLIEHDPTAGIPYPKIPRRTVVTLTAEQARHLMDTVKGERFAPILVLSLGIGCRRGEALGLRSQDIVWEDDDGRARDRTATSPRSLASTAERVGGHVGVAAPGDPARPVSVTISKGLRYITPSLRAEGEGPYRLTGTKTGESRVVPLPAFVADALRDRIEERDREQRAAKVWAPNDFVFCNQVGNAVALETLNHWFKGALGRAGLPNMRWHDLRASTITLLLDAGVDLLTIQRIVGHRNLETTRLYVGETPTAMAKAAAKLGEAIG